MARRDEDRFIDFVAAHQDRLRRTAFLMTGDWASADDATQDALVRLYVALPRLARVDSLLGYARRAVVNAAIDAGRKKQVREQHERRHTPPDSVPDGAERRATRAAVVDALAALPPRQRSAVVLRYVEDLTVADTAEALGCSAGTVKSQTARGLDTLRRVLVETGLRDELELEVSDS